MAMQNRRNWDVFWSSFFFVLGFSVVFSLVGILLQTVLNHVSYTVQEWLGRVGGIIIIFFGLLLTGLIHPVFLQREHAVRVTGRFRSSSAASFIFGAAFAVGWTPCASTALGAILALASSNPSSAFFLLFAYTLGIGVPFLAVGFFATQAQVFIQRARKSLVVVQYVFGALLIFMGVLIFAGQLSRIANLEFLAAWLTSLNLVSGAGGGINGWSILSFGIAFFAGLASFLSPCILPLVPGFLSYLATEAVGNLMEKYHKNKRRPATGAIDHSKLLP